MLFRSSLCFPVTIGPHLERTLDLIHADNISHSAQSNMPNQISNIRRRFKELEEKDKGINIKPPLNGNDIMEILGITKGHHPVIGRLLALLKDKYLDDPTMTRDEAIDIVKNNFIRS